MKARTATILRLVGLAGLAGVAATGVVIARDQRQRSQLTPDEVRARLQARYAEVTATAPGAAATSGMGRRSRSTRGLVGRRRKGLATLARCSFRLRAP